MTPNVKFVKRPATREEWLALRKPYIGGSDVASVLGLSPWRTPYQLWAEKTGRQVEEPKNPLSLELGSYEEDFVARKYAQLTGRTVRNFGYMVCDDESHLCADIDRLVVPDGESIAAYREDIRTDVILECKTAQFVWDEEAPAYYLTQLQTYMGLTGCPHADIAVLFRSPRVDFRIVRVDFNPVMFDGIREKVREWHEAHIARDVAPPPVCEEDCRTRFAIAKGGTEIRATPRIMEVAEILKSAQARADKADEDIEKCRAEIMAYMGEADILLDAENPARKIATWKQGKDRETTDWRAVAETLAKTEEPAHVQAIVAANTTTKPGARVFRPAK